MDNKQFWERWGFKLYNPDGKIKNMPTDWARYPEDLLFEEDGTRMVCGHLPDPDSLDALFEYCVPQLEEKLGYRDYLTI